MGREMGRRGGDESIFAKGRLEEYPGITYKRAKPHQRLRKGGFRVYVQS